MKIFNMAVNTLTQLLSTSIDISKIFADSAKLYGSTATIQPIVKSQIQAFVPVLKAQAGIEINQIRNHINNYITFSKKTTEKLQAKQLIRAKKKAQAESQPAGFPFAVSKVATVPKEFKEITSEVEPAPTRPVQQLNPVAQQYKSATATGIGGRKQIQPIQKLPTDYRQIPDKKPSIDEQAQVLSPESKPSLRTRTASENLEDTSDETQPSTDQISQSTLSKVTPYGFLFSFAKKHPLITLFIVTGTLFLIIVGFTLVVIIPIALLPAFMSDPENIWSILYDFTIKLINPFA